MSAEYVRRYYGVDYKRGDRVVIDGKPGTIVSFPNQYLGVRFDGENHTERCHPKWRVEREYDVVIAVGCSQCAAAPGEDCEGLGDGFHLSRFDRVSEASA